MYPVLALLLLAATVSAVDEVDTTSTPRDQEYETKNLKSPLKGVYDETREAYAAGVSSETIEDRSLRLAQFNVARLIKPIEDPANNDFFGMLAQVNRAADLAPGFVWRATHPEDGHSHLIGHAAEWALPDDPLLVPQLSVWETFKTFNDFVNRGIHNGMISRKFKWFEVIKTPPGMPRPPTSIGWWVSKDDPPPSVDEAYRRLEMLAKQGQSTHTVFFMRDASDFKAKGRSPDVKPDALASEKPYCTTDFLKAGPNMDFLQKGNFHGRQLQTADLWHQEWTRRIECWWIGLPVPTQGQLGACMGALGLHLGSKFGAVLKSSGISRGAMDQATPPAETGCEWVSERVEQLNLPEFPEIGPLEWTVPAIPRLLPGWQRLHSILEYSTRHTLIALSPAAVLPEEASQADDAPEWEHASAHARLTPAELALLAHAAGAPESSATTGVTLGAAAIGGIGGAFIGIGAAVAMAASKRRMQVIGRPRIVSTRRH